MTTPLRGRILFLEGAPDVARVVSSMLERHSFEVLRADDPQRALERVKTDHYDVVIVEVKALSNDQGLRFLRHVNESVPHLTTKIVVISSDPSPSVLRELEVIGVCDILLKPIHEEEILSAIRECLDRTPVTVH